MAWIRPRSPSASHKPIVAGAYGHKTTSGRDASCNHIVCPGLLTCTSGGTPTADEPGIGCCSRLPLAVFLFACIEGVVEVGVPFTLRELGGYVRFAGFCFLDFLRAFPSPDTRW